MGMIERTLVILKPDAVQRMLTGRILQRFEDAGLKIIGMKMVWVTPEEAEKHYAEHAGKPFYTGLVEYIRSGPVIALVLEGVNAVSVTRKLIGSTEPSRAEPGTIRGDFAHVSMAYADEKGVSVKNLIHASSSPADAEREIRLWFKPEELHSYKTVHDVHILE